LTDFHALLLQTVSLEKMLNDRGMKIDQMLVLDVDHDELVKRLIARAELSEDLMTKIRQSLRTGLMFIRRKQNQ